jgi:hypothetical protein
MTPDANAASFGDLSPGATFGSYRINRLLGRGGMGAVYEAVHQSDGRVVALKLLSVDLDQMDARQRFLREGQTAAAINHPNAVYIYGTEEISGTPVISMELVAGGTLEDKVKARGPLPVAEAVEDVIQIIDGLDAALAAGVLHRDVKPANCFVNTSGVVKIGDFGLSKPVDGEEQLKLTRTGVFLGTPVFSSPEQLLGETLDVRSDIYAVGVTFYYLLTGQLPYSSGSMMQVVAAVLNGAPTPLHSLRPDLPQPVVEVVMNAIARKTADRYQNYDEFRAAVKALRAPDVAPATLWDRARAGVVDFAIVGFVTWVLFWGVVTALGKTWTSASPQGLKLDFAIGLVISILVTGIPEALRGTTVGKWLVGIHVARTDGSIPGIARGIGRVAVFRLIDFLSIVAQLAPVSVTARGWLTLFATFGLRALLFVTVRKSNGWMLLQDFVTGTRVLKRRAEAQKRHGETQLRAAPVLAGTERRIGPYAVVGTLAAEGAVMLGWDASMHRSVWVVTHEPGAPDVPQPRRDLARLSRLRWVAGRRTVAATAGAENWDAYEAPLGEPLAARLDRPVPWNVLQEWMLDLTAELIAAAADGTMPHALTPRALWVTPADRIVIPESTLSSNRDLATETNAVAFVVQLLDLVRDANRDATPLPRHAARALAETRNARSVEEVQALFAATVGRPVEISRARRTGLIAATLVTVMFIPVVAIVPIQQQSRSDPEGRTFAGLLQFIGDSIHAVPDSLRPRKAKQSGNLMARANRDLEKAGWFTNDSAIARISPEVYREQNRLARVYVAGVLASRIRDSLSTSVFGRSPPEIRLGKEILRQYATIDSTDLRAARLLVDSTWKGNPPGTSVDLLIRVVGAVLFVFVPWFVAGCAIAFGLAIRRGPLMRGFQVDIVTADGAPASRARILVRNLVIWSPMLLPFLTLATVEASPGASAALAMYGVEAAVGVMLLAAIWMAIRVPSRGPADIVAGTWLVPE